MLQKRVAEADAMRGPLPMLNEGGPVLPFLLSPRSRPCSPALFSPQFAMWVDAVIFVFSAWRTQISSPDRLPLLQPHGQPLNTSEIPLVLVGTQVSGHLLRAGGAHGALAAEPSVASLYFQRLASLQQV